jgi:hypothetical protein
MTPKNILAIAIGVVALLSSAGAHAEDCMHDPIYERDWNAVITTGARVRNIPCMETSEVLGTVPVGQVVHVIAETDGYYKIETASGITGWSGQWLMAATDQAFNVQSNPVPAAPATKISFACKSGDALTDICGHDCETAIRYLFGKGVVAGYSDSSFKPNATINRAEFVKIIVGSVLGYDPKDDTSEAYSSEGLPFTDVESGAWYIPYLWTGVQKGLIAGYPDGTFRPSRTINLSEAAKILAVAYGMELGEASGAWYKPYVEALQGQSAIPMSLKTLSQTVTRGEMSEMIWRIMEKVTSKTFRQFDL